MRKRVQVQGYEKEKNDEEEKKKKKDDDDGEKGLAAKSLRHNISLPRRVPGEIPLWRTSRFNSFRNQASAIRNL